MLVVPQLLEDPDLVKEVAHYKQLYHQKCLKPFGVADLPS